MDNISARGNFIRWESNGTLVVDRPFYGAEKVLMRQRDEACSDVEQLREALRRVKDKVCGEALPNWENTPLTGCSRGWIADECDIALGNVTKTHNAAVKGGA